MKTDFAAFRPAQDADGYRVQSAMIGRRRFDCCAALEIATLVAVFLTLLLI